MELADLKNELKVRINRGIHKAYQTQDGAFVGDACCLVQNVPGLATSSIFLSLATSTSQIRLN